MKYVFVIGTAAPGGIRTVIEGYKSMRVYGGTPSMWLVSHVEGGIFFRLRSFARATYSLLLNLMRNRVLLLHLHISMRGSFWRKILFLHMAHWFRVPVILHMHGSEFRKFHASLLPPIRELANASLSRASCVIALSDSWKKFYQGICTAPVETVPNVVPSVDAQSAVSDDGGLRMLFMGKFGQRKGIYELLSACARLRAQGIDFSLDCAGNGEIEQVDREISRLNLHSVVVNHGWVDSEQRTQLLASNNVLVLPSWNEGLPMSVLEGMAGSLAIVSTRVGGIPEVVEEGSNGFLIEPGDIEALSSALARLAKEPSLRRQMQKNCKSRHCRHYSEEVARDRIGQILKAIGV